jgi:hypothetical protein
MSEPLSIIPEANHALRTALLQFVLERDEAVAARIIHMLRNDPVELFIHVSREVGAPGEPPITAADLVQLAVADGRFVRMVVASTKLTPDNIATELGEGGTCVRQLPAKRLLELCAERGVLMIELDGGLDTEVFVGPIMEGRDLMVKVFDLSG